ncbi:MAG: DNA-binding protein [Chitinophagaceae bacterium]|nr:MAG: DNA-binding protein [Chitinophagaceae bacterium]
MTKLPQQLPQPSQTVAVNALDVLQSILLDNADLMQALHVSRNTLYNWRRKKILQFVKLGQRIFYLMPDLEKLLQLLKQKNQR